MAAWFQSLLYRTSRSVSVMKSGALKTVGSHEISVRTSGVISSVCFTGVSGSDLGGVTFGFAFGAVSHARRVKRNNVGDITFGELGWK